MFNLVRILWQPSNNNECCFGYHADGGWGIVVICKEAVEINYFLL